MPAELSELQIAYREYFVSVMEKHGIDGLGELSESELKAFFNDVSSGWVKGKGPKKQPKESSISDRLSSVAAGLRAASRE
jgi:hypothetical protein